MAKKEKKFDWSKIPELPADDPLYKLGWIVGIKLLHPDLIKKKDSKDKRDK